MRRLLFLLLTNLALPGLSGCESPASPPTPTTTGSPNTLPPSFIANGVLYLNTGELLDIDPDESEYLGTVTSTVPLAEWPTEEGQANLPIEGAPYVAHSEGMALWVFDKWIFYKPWRNVTK